MKVAKVKKVPVRKALEMTSMEVDGESKSDQLLKQVKKSGITKKVSSTGKKLGKKDKQVSCGQDKKFICDYNIRYVARDKKISWLQRIQRMC
jgi:hypothetical protein